MGRLAAAIAVVCLHGADGLRRSKTAAEEQTVQTYTDPPLTPDELDDVHWQAVHGHNKPRIFEGGEEKVSTFTLGCDQFNGDLCKAPFSCNTSWTDINASSRPSMAWPNYHLWCGYPAYAYAGLMCEQKRYDEYGNALLKAQMTRGWGTMAVEAQYCFAYGHCDDHNVTKSTTIEQAVEICNEKFDKQWWPKEKEEPGFPIYNREVSETIDQDDEPTEEKKSKAKGIGHAFYSTTTIKYKPRYGMWRLKERAKTACLMGNYHCDVIYCQEHYCSEPYYRAKFNEDRPEFFKTLYGNNYPPLVDPATIGSSKAKGPAGGYA